MGNCLSDVKGGKQAVGGVGDGGAAAASGLNDAVDYFYRVKGEHALFTQIEVLKRRINKTRAIYDSYSR